MYGLENIVSKPLQGNIRKGRKSEKEK